MFKDDISTGLFFFISACAPQSPSPRVLATVVCAQMTAMRTFG
jgi:hypothetical protein